MASNKMTSEMKCKAMIVPRSHAFFFFLYNSTKFENLQISQGTSNKHLSFCLFFLIFTQGYAFTDFREREREKETHQCMKETNGLPPICSPTGDRTQNLGMCPNQESNSQSWCTGRRSNQVTPARACFAFF